MAIRINGKFSEEDRKILEQGYRNVVFRIEDGDEDDQAYCERGLRGLSYAINFLELVDKDEAEKYAWLLSSAQLKNGIKVLPTESVRQMSASLSALNSKLKDFFDFGGYLKPEKAEFIKSILPETMIRKTEDDDGRKVDAVVEPMWEFLDAQKYLNVAARLNREIILGS